VKIVVRKLALMVLCRDAGMNVRVKIRQKLYSRSWARCSRDMDVGMKSRNGGVRSQTSVWIGLTVAIFACGLTTAAWAAKSAPVYFPKGIFSRVAEADRGRAVRYARYLQALREPSLYELKGNSKAVQFRFLCLRLFDRPFAIRVEALANGGGKVYFKVSDGTGGYRPGNLETIKTVKLTKTQMQSCLSKFIESGFWSLASQTANLDGYDRVPWVLEGVQNGKYNLVERQSPSRGSVRKLGLYLLKLSGEKVRDLD
jgi:hypothetical protein